MLLTQKCTEVDQEPEEKALVASGGYTNLVSLLREKEIYPRF